MKHWLKGIRGALSYVPLKIWWEKNRFWVFILSVILGLYVLALVFRTIRTNRAIRLKERELQTIRKDINGLEATELEVAQEMETLRQTEIIIIEKYGEQAMGIIRIPKDSLQYYADSLYNSL